MKTFVANPTFDIVFKLSVMNTVEAVIAFDLLIFLERMLLGDVAQILGLQ